MTTDDLRLFLRSQRRQLEPPFTFHTIISAEHLLLFACKAAAAAAAAAATFTTKHTTAKNKNKKQCHAAFFFLESGVAVVQGPSKLKPDRDGVCGVRGAEDDAAADRK
eukprot:1787172-Rhodomonas_salina.1